MRPANSRSCRAWTAADDAVARSVAAGELSPAQAAARLGRTRKAVADRVGKLGIGRRRSECKRIESDPAVADRLRAADGVGVLEVARALGVARATVLAAWTRMGIAAADHPRPPHGPAAEARLAGLLAAGLKVKAAARALGMAVATAYDMRRRLGLAGAAPCARCGTAEGGVPDGNRRPARLSGARYGFDGAVCVGCYETLRSRSRPPRAIPAARPAPAESPDSASSWAMEARARMRLRDAHRLRAAYAAKLAERERLPIRESWRAVADRVDAGAIVLPARVRGRRRATTMGRATL